MRSIIRLVSCLVSVATILLKCVQQLEWATVFLCCFVKLRSHCCYPCNFQGSTNTWPTKNKQAKTYIGDLLGFWHLVFPASIAQTRGENLRWMSPRCFPDAPHMLPTTSKFLTDGSSASSSTKWLPNALQKTLFGVSRWAHLRDY